MFNTIKSLFQKPLPESPSYIGRLCYAIGDIHGRDDLFQRLMVKISNDANAYEQEPLFVFLGDYIDRGPGSRAVIDHLISLSQAKGCEVICLMGNHEAAMLNFIENPAEGAAWLQYGGLTTLASYGVNAPDTRLGEATWEQTHEALLSAVPLSHLEFLSAMKPSFQLDDYFFVHAGVDPRRPLAEQDSETFYWIRAPFLTVPKSCDYVVVHGHTPSEAYADLRWRIGIDTGAYATGHLCAVRLWQDERHFIQT